MSLLHSHPWLAILATLFSQHPFLKVSLHCQRHHRMRQCHPPIKWNSRKRRDTSKKIKMCSTDEQHLPKMSKIQKRHQIKITIFICNTGLQKCFKPITCCKSTMSLALRRMLFHLQSSIRSLSITLCQNVWTFLHTSSMAL